MIKSLKTICALIGIIIPLSVSAQLTLDKCQILAQENYPLLKKYDLIRQTTTYSISNINKGYLPQLSFSGQTTYQSGVATLPDLLSNMMKSNGYDYKGLNKDQYKIGLDLNQTIWDGGNLKAQKKVTTLQGNVQTAQTDVDMYAIRDRINNLFFGILLIDNKIRLNEDLQALLFSNCQKLESMLMNGTAMKADVDVVRAEYLKAKQQMTELLSIKESYQRIMSIFIGKDVTTMSSLQKPTAEMPVTYENIHPELKIFSTQLQQADAQRRLLDAELRPKLNLFAQGYYGYTGYDMFNDMFNHDLTLNGIIGVRLSWNISKLYTYKNDKRKIDLSCRQIETNRDVFLFNSNLLSTQEEMAISQYRKMVTEDKEIISLRTSVRQAAEAKLEHGIIDVNNLLQEITRENQARIEQSSHEIEMLKNIYELKNTINQ
jgi:Outer membrane protein